MPRKPMNEQILYEQLIKWLEEHNGKMPRGSITVNHRSLRYDEMTEEEAEEVRLYQRWKLCPTKKILDEYIERPIEDVPEEYRERIRVLRSYGLGVTVYEEIVKWLEEHNGRMPSSVIAEEASLYDRWYRCPERKILEKYKERPIEEVPEKFREKIRVLRSYGLGITTYEQTVKWLEEHDKKMPRNIIYKNGKQVKREKMTEEEKEETNLYLRWYKYCPEKKILDKYVGRPIEEVPEEFREKIARLRELGQLGKRKDDKIKDRMRKAVANQVANNEKVREELEGENEKKSPESEGIEPYDE